MLELRHRKRELLDLLLEPRESSLCAPKVKSVRIETVDDLPLVFRGGCLRK